ncbi:MAG: energy-coupling factor ABC transporter permease [Candidatus Aadella gelida]|nr:energy-coupling factor ABC transporter permease [Candidatus Aadella gelida]
MHIPNSMLHGGVCPVTAVLSALGVLLAAFTASRAKNKPTAAKFGAITALIFAGQMMNFPISSGTSGHLLGGVMAVALLGMPFGVLAMALVVTIQCLVFSDGGFTVLGANILNMAIIGAGIGGLINAYLVKKFSAKSSGYAIGLGVTAWVSVMLAALACSLELGISGAIAFPKVVGAMLGTHAIIGIGEGLITVAVCFALASEPIKTSPRRSVTVPLVASGIIAMMLSPFASGFPDGLEWVAAKYQFFHESAPSFVSPLTDYSVSWIGNEAVSTSLAGLAGVFLTFLIAWGAARILTSPRHPQTIA